MQRIAIVDYGMGNLHSVASALQHVAPEAEVSVTQDKAVILAADRVVLPGVGAIRDCMAEIKRLGVDRLVADIISQQQPLLGICVGMQVLLSFSEENGGVDCLDHFSGKVAAFQSYPAFREESLKDGAGLKVPHMGWNQVRMQAHPLWHGIGTGSRFYFVHSYCVKLNHATEEVGACHYGTDFSAAIARDAVFATQFHPEKSHRDGLKLLENFSRWAP